MTHPSFLGIPKTTQAVLRATAFNRASSPPPSLSPFFSYHVTKLQAPFGVFLNNSRTLVFLYHFFLLFLPRLPEPTPSSVRNPLRQTEVSLSGHQFLSLEKLPCAQLGRGAACEALSLVSHPLIIVAAMNDVAMFQQGCGWRGVSAEGPTGGCGTATPPLCTVRLVHSLRWEHKSRQTVFR